RFTAPALLSRPPPRIAHRRLAEGARGLLDAGLEVRLRLADRADVGFGFPALRALGAAIELPRGDDDFLLRGHQFVDAPAGAAAGHRRAPGERELLLEGLHLEKEDVAPRFVRSRA